VKKLLVFSNLIQPTLKSLQGWGVDIRWQRVPVVHVSEGKNYFDADWWLLAQYHAGEFSPYSLFLSCPSGCLDAQQSASHWPVRAQMQGG